LIRVSRLLNRPVICANKQAGFLQSVILDEAQRQIESLIIVCGLRGKSVVPARAISAISEEFILAAHIQKYTRGDERRSPCFIRDTSGLLVGRVSDYALNEETLKISAIEMIRGYLPAERRMRIWLFSYTVSETRLGELVVPLIQGLESMNQKEENACEYQQ